MVTKGAVHVEVPAQAQTNLQLVFSPRIGDNLPVVYSACKSDVRNCASEHV